MGFMRITIIRSESTPKSTDINELLQWFGGTLGLFNQRDKDKSCYRIFVSLLAAVKENKPGLSSDELALRTRLTRGTVIHHLNKLMEAGIVVNKRGKYSLAVDNLEELVEQIRLRLNRTLDGLKAISSIIDEKLGI